MNKLKNVLLSCVFCLGIISHETAGADTIKIGNSDQSLIKRLSAEIHEKNKNEMRFSISWPGTSIMLVPIPLGDRSILNFNFRFDHHINRFCYAFSTSFNGLLNLFSHFVTVNTRPPLWVLQDFLIGGIPYKSRTVKFAINVGGGFVEMKRPLDKWIFGARVFAEFAWFRTKGNLYALEIGWWRAVKCDGVYSNKPSGFTARFTVAWNML